LARCPLPPKADTPALTSTSLLVVQPSGQLGATETPHGATSSSPEDTARVGIATSLLARWRLAASGSNLKPTVRGDSTAHWPRSCLRVIPSVRTRWTAGAGDMNAAGQALSQKALVWISPAFGSGGLARSPRSKRVRPGLGATAFLIAPATAALSQRRRGIVPIRPRRARVRALEFPRARRRLVWGAWSGVS
jgi:hypothetical protein